MNKLPVFISWLLTHTLIYIAHIAFINYYPTFALIFISTMIAVTLHRYSVMYFIKVIV